MKTPSHPPPTLPAHMNLYFSHFQAFKCVTNSEIFDPIRVNVYSAVWQLWSGISFHLIYTWYTSYSSSAPHTTERTGNIYAQVNFYWTDSYDYANRLRAGRLLIHVSEIVFQHLGLIFKSSDSLYFFECSTGACCSITYNINCKNFRKIIPFC